MMRDKDGLAKMLPATNRARVLLRGFFFFFFILGRFDENER